MMSTSNNRRYKSSQNICIITTNKSPSILQSSSSSSSSANSSIQILDPQTGSILSTSSDHPSSTGTDHNNGGNNDVRGSRGNSDAVSSTSTSIKINAGVGLHSLHPIQFLNDKSANSSTNEHLYIAYGNQYKDNVQQYQQAALSMNDGKDMYAYLLVQGGSSSSSSSSPKWKCKLPEYMSGKLITSPCGYYIIGGGKSGTCYCWSTLSTSSPQGDTTKNYNNSIIGGGASTSGSNGSELVCKWIAHYRPIKSISFSDCGFYIITGGDDGIVNVWNLMDIVSSGRTTKPTSIASSSKNRSIHPMQTWSEHHLPVTSIHTLPSSRIVSTSLDKQVIIMELFNGKTLAKINLPSSITFVTSDSMGWRLYLGGLDGVIYCIDLNTYAIATTAESATVISSSSSPLSSHLNSDHGNVQSLSGSMLEETVLGMNSSYTTAAANNDAISNITTTTSNINKRSSESSYVTELRGHNRQISCLALLEENDDDVPTLLVSGSVDGSIRIWDIRSRCCIRNIYPWSNNHTLLGQEMMKDGSSTSATSSKNIVFPCSSITVIPRKWIDDTNDDDNAGSVFTSSTNGNSSKKRKRKKHNNEALVDLIKPLERFTKYEQRFDDGSNDESGDDKDYAGFAMAFTKPLKKKNHLDLISVNESSYDDYSTSVVTKQCKEVEKDLVDEVNDKDNRQGKESVSGSIHTGNSVKEAELVDELKRLREEVARWQKVNNKLMLKLKKTAIN